MKKKLKIYFADFWATFDKKNNYFTDILNDEYEIVLDEINPDLLIYSVFGNSFINYNCKRIFFTGENVRPNFDECDFAMTFDHIDDNKRHFRLPLYTLFGDVNELLKPKDIDKILAEKTKFCNFIYSNPRCKIRNDFFKKLSKYKQVDSAGRFNNNLGKPVDNKLEFIRDYKFTFAFENSEFIGYTTEKIFEPMIVNSLPIYWGNPLVHLDFNPASYLNYYDYDSDEELIDKIIELDTNPDKYAEYIREPYFHNNEINQYVKRDNVKAFLFSSVEAEINPVSANSPLFKSSYLVSSIYKSYTKTAYKFNRTKWKYINNFSIERLKMKIFSGY